MQELGLPPQPCCPDTLPSQVGGQAVLGAALPSHLDNRGSEKLRALGTRLRSSCSYVVWHGWCWLWLDMMLLTGVTRQNVFSLPPIIIESSQNDGLGRKGS